MKARYDSYVALLKAAGFTQATNRPEHFYKLTTEKTAFILNIYNAESQMRIVYGFTSTAFFAFGEGDRKFFEQFGTSDDDCTLRYVVEINNDDDANSAKKQIDAFYYNHHSMETDELLAVAKERRKEYIQQIGSLLKPLKFKKKGNKWTRSLSEDYYVEFYAQKSAFSDQYYFNISIDPVVGKGPFGCYYTRIVSNETDIFDWQLMPADEMQTLLANSIQNLIHPILNTPLPELGKKSWIWKQCSCKLDSCENCWVTHNLWEAKEMEECQFEITAKSIEYRWNEILPDCDW